MSETLQELADVPKDFLRDGTQFLNRCTKRMWISEIGNSIQIEHPLISFTLAKREPLPPGAFEVSCLLRSSCDHFHTLLLPKLHADISLSLADKREFIKISQAVGFGFLIMGAIGYVIKLSEPARLYKTHAVIPPALGTSATIQTFITPNTSVIIGLDTNVCYV
jgi:preprotein translocase subunit Sss1